jgi:tetrahydromethanopterin S-methyltransferase subunit H
MKTVIVSYGPINEVKRQFPDNATVRDVVTNPNVRTALGHGSNVQALDTNRRVLSLDSYISDNQSIVLETVANTKANDMGGGAQPQGTIAVTVEFGPINSTTKQFPAGTTVGDVIRNPSVRAALGHGDNVQATVDNVPQSMNTVLEDGDTIQLEVVANQKAAR